MMRTLIASNSEDIARDIRSCLVREGVDCRDEDVVALDRVLDRASRTMPELLVIVLPSHVAARGAGFEELRETCSTIQKVYALAVGPATDPKLILRALHEGAAEYIDQSHLKTELAGALGRLKARRAARSANHSPGRVISVMAPSGGSGSSMLAANISTILASQHRECGLLDLRLAAGDLTSMLDLKPAHTLADFCDRASRVDHRSPPSYPEGSPPGAGNGSGPVSLRRRRLGEPFWGRAGRGPLAIRPGRARGAVGLHVGAQHAPGAG
jgi:pilus assembly protein CpaE